jgi:hypothetical protein
MASTTQADEGNEMDGLSDSKNEVVEEIVGAVEGALANRTALSDVLGELNRERLRGDPVQSELEAVYDASEELQVLARIDRTGRLEELLELAADAGALDEQTREEFEGWWQSVDWIVPGAKAYDRERSSVYNYWTDRELDFSSVGGQLVVEHTLWHGVDRLYRIQAPIDDLFIEATQRLQMLSRVLPVAAEKGDVDTEDIKRIADLRETLLEIADALDDADEMEALIDEVSGRTDEESDGDDGGALLENENGDEPPAASIGFQ